MTALTLESICEALINNGIKASIWQNKRVYINWTPKNGKTSKNYVEIKNNNVWYGTKSYVTEEIEPMLQNLVVSINTPKTEDKEAELISCYGLDAYAAIQDEASEDWDV